MNKKLIRLTEGDLHRIVKESLKRVLKESEFDDFGIAYDKRGNEIHKGDMVIWFDPETGRKTKYEVYEEPTEDMVKLWSRYGECEALTRECLVV